MNIKYQIMNNIQKIANRILVSGAIVSLAFITNISDAQHSIGERGFSNGGSRTRGGGSNFNSGGSRSFDRGQSFTRPQSSVQSRPSFNAHPDRNNPGFTHSTITNTPRQSQIARENSVVERRSPVITNSVTYNRPVPVQKPVYRPVPRTNVTVVNNYGHGYGYSCGGFYYGGGYHYYPVYYHPFVPYYGIRINVLPFGYYPFYFNSYPYYFYNGYYYRQYNDYYETVEPPLGARVPELPSGARSVKIDGQKYYEYNGTYYQKVYNERGETLYEVVGTDGVLETDKPKQSEFRENLKDQSAYLSQLPADSRAIELEGKTYYVSPGGQYYSQVIDKDNNVYYILAGNELTEQ